MSSLKERLISSRKEKLLSQTQLAKLAQVSQSAIAAIETGRNQSTTYLPQIAAVLGVDPLWLSTGTASAKVSANAVPLGSFEEWDSQTPINADDFEVPFFKQTELAAGNGREVVDDRDGFKLRFAKSTLKKAGVTPCHARCVTVSGNSMEPVLPDGSTVGIDTGSTQIKDGKVYAIDHDGALRIKVLYCLPNGGLRLRSFNRDEWDDEDLSYEQAMHVRVIGRMFWSSALW